MAQGLQQPGLGAPHPALRMALRIPALWKIQDGTPEANSEGLLAVLQGCSTLSCGWGWPHVHGTNAAVAGAWTLSWGNLLLCGSSVTAPGQIYRRDITNAKERSRKAV